MLDENFGCASSAGRHVQRDDDELLLPPKNESTPASPAGLKQQRPLQQQAFAPDASLDDMPPHPAVFPTTTSASSIDAIAYGLSRQYLVLDDSLSRPTPPDAQLDPDSASLVSSSFDTAPSRAVLPKTSAPESWWLSLDKDDDAAKSKPAASVETMRLRQKMSARFQNPQNSRVMQNLVDGMTCAGSQCNVRNSPSLVPKLIEANSPSRMELDPPSLEVDENYADKAEYEMLFVEKMLEQSRTGVALAMRRQGLPVFRSSTETALRCKNLVRNKPRMRKRTKLRDKPSSSAMSAAAART